VGCHSQRFEVFGNLEKLSFEFLIWLLKPFITPGEIQSKSSQNFMIIKIRTITLGIQTTVTVVVFSL